MAARLITERDLTRRAPDVAATPLVVDADTLITPAALDAAARLGIVVTWSGRRGEGLLTAADVERVPAGSRIEIAPGTLVTPLARDRAAVRSIEVAIQTVSVRSALPEPSPAAPAASIASGCAVCASASPATSPVELLSKSRLRIDDLRDLFSPSGAEGAC